MHPRADPSDQVSIVGRERETRMLRAILDRALGGNGSLALVSGEAGIGKTTLLRELLRTAAHART